MAPLKSILLASILALSSTATAKHGPYIPISTGPFPSGTGAPFPSGTGTGFSHGTGTGVIPYPTGGSPGSGGPGSGGPGSGGPGSGGPGSIQSGGLIESAASCPLPVTVTSTTQVYVTVTVPAPGEAGSTAPPSPPHSVPGGGVGPIVGSGTGIASTGAPHPTGFGSFNKRMEMRGLEQKKEKKRGFFWA